MFVIVLVMLVDVCAVKLSPVVFGLSVAIHEYVDVTLLVMGIFKATPLQIVDVFTEVMSGKGFTVTVKFCAVPGHVPLDEVGVIV